MKRKGEDVCYFRYRRNGKEVAVKIGAFPTKTAARKEVDRLGLREQANTPVMLDRSVPVTFGRVVGLWLKKELSTQAVTSQKGIRFLPSLPHPTEVAKDSSEWDKAERPAGLALFPARRRGVKGRDGEENQEHDGRYFRIRNVQGACAVQSRTRMASQGDEVGLRASHRAVVRNDADHRRAGKSPA